MWKCHFLRNNLFSTAKDQMCGSLWWKEVHYMHNLGPSPWFYERN